jgi:hypothetical protein
MAADKVCLVCGMVVSTVAACCRYAHSFLFLPINCLKRVEFTVCFPLDHFSSYWDQVPIMN